MEDSQEEDKSWVGVEGRLDLLNHKEVEQETMTGLGLPTKTKMETWEWIILRYITYGWIWMITCWIAYSMTGITPEIMCCVTYCITELTRIMGVGKSEVQKIPKRTDQREKKNKEAEQHPKNAQTKIEKTQTPSNTGEGSEWKRTRVINGEDSE